MIYGNHNREVSYGSSGRREGKPKWHDCTTDATTVCFIRSVTIHNWRVGGRGGREGRHYMKDQNQIFLATLAIVIATLPIVIATPHANVRMSRLFFLQASRCILCTGVKIILHTVTHYSWCRCAVHICTEFRSLFAQMHSYFSHRCQVNSSCKRTFHLTFVQIPFILLIACPIFLRTNVHLILRTSLRTEFRSYSYHRYLVFRFRIFI